MEKPYLPGLQELTSQPLPTAPTISPEYESAVSKLVFMQRKGVTHFYGSELDLGPNRNVWMSPVEVSDERSYSYFQLLYVYTTPQETLGNKDMPVSLLEVDEASFKLTPLDHPGYH